MEDRLNAGVARVLRRRGWVPRIVGYTGYGGEGWARVLGRVLLTPELAETTEDRRSAARQEEREREPEAVRGWRSFFTAPLPDVEVEVHSAGEVHRVRTDRGGYVDAVVPVSLPPGWHEVELRTEGAERSQRARVLVVGPEPTLGLLSDIDDTVLVTSLPRPLIAAWNTFVRHDTARRAVPGMASLYQRFVAAHPSAPVVYLSTGAWNVAGALERFLDRKGYPAGPLLLTDWGPTNTGWFRAGSEHKTASLRRLARELPQVRWVLVGDDGQHDPQIYGDFVEEHPERVCAVAIRQLTPTEQVLSHGTPVPERTAPRRPASRGGAARAPEDVPTVRAPDGLGLSGQLARLGLV